MKYSYVYILFNKRNGTLYVGITADLVKRIYEHKEKHTSVTAEYGDYDIVELWEEDAA